MVVICLKSTYNNKYLRFRNEDVRTHSLLQFSGDKPLDAYTHFEMVNSNISDDHFHLKCKYNNKYLVRWSPIHYWISASADLPDENQSSWTCTLFKRINIDDASGTNTKKVRIMHVQLGHYLLLLRIGAPFDSCLFAQSKDIDKGACDIFNFVNLDTLFITLPKRVAFKGQNGKYLGAFVSNNGRPYLQFSYNDLNDPRVEHEMTRSPDGIVCIKSKHYAKFWRLGIGEGDWIIVDAEDPRGSNNASAMFRANIVDFNAIALLNMDKTWYCKSYTDQGFENCLNAAATNADASAVLQLIDLGAIQG